MTTALVELCCGAWTPDDTDAFHRWEAQRDRRDQENTGFSNAVEDADLIDRIRRGDSTAFDTLMLARFARLVRFAMGIVHDRAVAEDVVQDVFVRVWAQRETLRITSLTAYLYHAVRNRALDVTRSTALRTRLQEPIRVATTEALEASAEFVDGAVDDAEASNEDPRVQRIRVSLAELPERRRTALRLRYEQELSYEDIAAVLGVTVNAAQQLVFHALRALRRQVGESA